MSLQEKRERRSSEGMQVDQVAEGALTELFQQLKIGRAGEPKMSDPNSVLTPRDVIMLRRLSTRNPMMGASDEEVLLTVLGERSEQLNPTEFANVIASWTQTYGWTAPKNK